jgi:hypothetical protein
MISIWTKNILLNNRINTAKNKKMKKLILIILFFSFSNAFAQYPILNDSIKKPGIYRTFEEFRNNQPSIVMNFKIASEEVKYGSIGFRKALMTYGLDFSAKMSQNIGLIYGFCDGKDIFIVSKTPTLSHYTSFFKIEHLGQICVFKYTYESVLAVTAVYMLTGGTRILNLKNGESLNLNKKNLKKIIKAKPELAARFDKEADPSNDTLENYLLEYIQS